MQESGEFKALSYQAFNFARIVFDNAAAPNRQKKAVVVDLDETMLDNSAYAAWRIKNNIPFKQADWTRWVNARQTTAIYRKDNAQRRQFVDQNKQLFGTKFIVLPNPSYGDWESGMAKGYYSLTPQGKLDARSKALRTWDGK